MNDNVSTELINKLIDGLSDIMTTSFTYCEDTNPTLSTDCSKINNTAFELKRIAVHLQRYLDFKEIKA